jgi:CBS domain-containing protein
MRRTSADTVTAGLTAMPAGRICPREVDLAEPGESVPEATRRVRERRVGTLVIVDDAGRPVGLLTDRDLALRVVAAGGDPRATREAAPTPGDMQERRQPLPCTPLSPVKADR